MTSYEYCSYCEEHYFSIPELIPATGHSDKDNDGVCDQCGTTVGKKENSFIAKIKEFFGKISRFLARLFGKKKKWFRLLSSGKPIRQFYISHTGAVIRPVWLLFLSQGCRRADGKTGAHQFRSVYQKNATVMCFRCSKKCVRCFPIETTILMVYHRINKERNHKKPTQKGEG